jgi:allantoinase
MTKLEEPMRMDALIRGGTIVLEQGCVAGSIAIKDGRIAGLLSPEVTVPALETVDVPGCLIMPGLIDPHCHFSEPSLHVRREDFWHGTRAAAAGGVTTVVEMPLNVPPPADEASLTLKLKTAKENAHVDFALWGALIPTSIPNLQHLWELGCVAFKAFMADVDDYQYMTDPLLFEAMREVAKFNGFVGVHAENNDMIDYYSKQLAVAGCNDGGAHAASRPELAELAAIKQAILMGEKTGCRLYVVHISIAEGVREIAQAKARGVKVSVETCPQYLTLTHDDLVRCGPFAKCNPPLRSKENVDRLWQCIREGLVDTIGSDHSPYPDDEREAGVNNIWKAPPGLAGLETMLPLLLDEGVRRGIDWVTLAKLTSGNVARLFNLYPVKGVIQPGTDADLAIIDPNQEWTVDGLLSFSKTKSDRGPYQGRRIRGKVVATLLRGQVIYRDGQIIGEPGYGKLVSRVL